jgi:hypothetical protein
MSDSSRHSIECSTPALKDSSQARRVGDNNISFAQARSQFSATWLTQSSGTVRRSTVSGHSGVGRSLASVWL